MSLNSNEIVMALAAGIIAGALLGFVAKQFPSSGIGTV